MNDDALMHHIAFGVAISYAIEALKRSPWFPWLSRYSAGASRAVSAVAALLSSVGIQWALQGNFAAGAVITVTVPSASVIFDTLVHAVGQFGIQQAAYKGLIQAPSPTMSLNTATRDVSVSVPVDVKEVDTAKGAKA